MTCECVRTGSILPRGTGRERSRCIDVNSRFSRFPLSDFNPSGLASSKFIFDGKSWPGYDIVVLESIYTAINSPPMQRFQTNCCCLCSNFVAFELNGEVV